MMTKFLCGVCLCLVNTAFADSRTELMDSVAVLRRDDNVAAAAEHLRAWIGAHPQDPEAHVLLGQVLADGGDHAEALQVWRQFLDSRPVDVIRYGNVARRLQAAGLVQEAVELLEEGTSRLDKTDPFAWQRAELLLILQDWAGAVEAHRSFLRQEPHRRPFVVNRIALLARGAAAEVPNPISGYVEALAAALDDVSGTERLALTVLLAWCALETADPEFGLHVLKQALDTGDVVRLALFQYASRCEQVGHTEVAARAYGLFVETSPASPLATRARLKEAQMLALSGDVDGAIVLYREMSAGDAGQSAQAMLRVAHLQASSLKDPAAALKTLATLDQLPGGNQLRTELLTLRADCRLRLGQTAAAIADWQQLARIPASRADAEFGLAELSFFTGQFDSASAFIDSLVSRQPSHARANDALALLLLIDEFADANEALAVLGRARLRERQGLRDQARADRQWLLQHAPAGLRHVSLLEDAVFFEQSAPDRALALYALVAADEPSERLSVSAMLGQARLLENAGQTEAALRTYESTVLTAPLDPRTPDVRRHIARLRTLLGDTG